MKGRLGAAFAAMGAALLAGVNANGRRKKRREPLPSLMPHYIGANTGYMLPIKGAPSKYKPHQGAAECARRVRFKERHGHWPGNTL